jgi:2-oxoglutarate dehydrogenase E1 component
MQDNSMEALLRTSHLSGGNASYVEELYESYLLDPNAVPEDWRGYFEKLPRVEGAYAQDVPHSEIIHQFELMAKNQSRPLVVRGEGSADIEHERKQVAVMELIAGYRSRGHQKAKLDPLNLTQQDHVPSLELAYHKLSNADLDTMFQTGSTFFDLKEASLKDIISALEATYCGPVGVETMHITDLEEKRWLQQRTESVRAKPAFSAEVKQHLLERMSAAEGLEKHLDSKYPGTKRFGLEGAESLIPMLDEMIQRSGSHGTKEIVIGMAHRGRLNTLVNILGKNPADLFDEFEGKTLVETSGDVKYHQGFSSNVMTSGGEVHLAMAFNPSHLEIVSPVVEGSVRARQDRRADEVRNTVVPIVIHGDAAFAGQGVVQETFQMSQTRAYTTGGTIHIVLNNQVGFTTNNREDARSTMYCTDVAKMIEAPILHVNGDDPEAVLFVTQLAADYRNEFKKDVVIDLVCYRRRGHNETDEPSATQPLMYKIIKTHKSAFTSYSAKLESEGVIPAGFGRQLMNDYREKLDSGKDVANALVSEPDSSLFVDWTPYLGHDWDAAGDTSYPIAKLKELGQKLCEVPDGVVMQRQVTKIYEDRRKMAAGALPINWGMAELLAYGSVLDHGASVRLTGQDVGRGTFSHRHAVVHSQNDGSAFIPMKHLAEEQPRFTINDSLLSEEAVLAFEYGYSTTRPNALIIWEAQFGDFANGAQVVIDQFITSGEHKWGRLCGLTMLLPHGYEGQGPEHSSARLERFLQLCAEHNIQVCIPTTPAQVFHMLRRQVIRPMRRPLVVMSPKWILRHPLATSSLEDLAEGGFQNVLQDPAADPAKVKRVVLCSGKVYYHLVEAREETGQQDVAFIRLEQLYPFPREELAAALAPYKNLKDVVWCQEEPMNQGAWYSSQHHLHHAVNEHDSALALSYVGREASAAPAAGSMSLHLEQQKRFLADALSV